MSHLRLITLWPSDEDLHEASGGLRRDLLDDYLAAIKAADPHAFERAEAAAVAYDVAHPDEPSLAAELDGCWIPAAA